MNLGKVYFSLWRGKILTYRELYQVRFFFLRADNINMKQLPTGIRHIPENYECGTQPSTRSRFAVSTDTEDGIRTSVPSYQCLQE